MPNLAVGFGYCNRVSNYSLHRSQFERATLPLGIERLSRVGVLPGGYLTDRWYLIFIVVLLPLTSVRLLAQATAPSPPTEPAPRSGAPQDQEISQRQLNEARRGTIVGTVTDVNDDAIPGATIVLQDPGPSVRRTLTTNENGWFEIRDVESGIPYHVTISATGFSSWTSPVFIVKPGQYKILDISRLRPEEVHTTVTVTPQSSEEIAAEEVKIEETQRGFGFVPNFFAVYNASPAPLTAKLKFSLAFKVATDPVTIAGVVMLAGLGQSTRRSTFSDDWKGFGEGLGANYANQFTYTMLGGAVLSSLLHQDPRYFYKGTGTTKSRTLHAVAAIFIAKGDNGRWQPSYSSLGADLASAAISNTYYPASNRGVRLVLQNFAVNTAVHMGVHLLQEFVFRPPKLQGLPAPAFAPQAVDP